MNFSDDVHLKNGIKCRKLREDNSNLDKFCGICKSKKDLYSIEYDLSEYETIDYGIHCRNCLEKIFGALHH